MKKSTITSDSPYDFKCHICGRKFVRDQFTYTQDCDCILIEAYSDNRDHYFSISADGEYSACIGEPMKTPKRIIPIDKKWWKLLNSIEEMVMRASDTQDEQIIILALERADELEKLIIERN